jgi:hypothetical protein
MPSHYAQGTWRQAQRPSGGHDHLARGAARRRRSDKPTAADSRSSGDAKARQDPRLWPTMAGNAHRRRPPLPRAGSTRPVTPDPNPSPCPNGLRRRQHLGRLQSGKRLNPKSTSPYGSLAASANIYGSLSLGSTRCHESRVRAGLERCSRSRGSRPTRPNCSLSWFVFGPNTSRADGIEIFHRERLDFLLLASACYLPRLR